MKAAEIAQQIDPNAKKVGNQWLCRCPAHDDNNPSFYIKDSEGQKNPLVHCFAGCSQGEVIKALGELGLWEGAETSDHSEWERNRQREISQQQWVTLLESIEKGDESGVKEYLNMPEPQPYRAADVMDLAAMFAAMPEEEWVTGPIQAGSIGFIAAAAGVGKSMFALGLAHAISTGKDFADWKTPTKRSVMLLDVELSTRFIYDRIKGYDWTGATIKLDWQDWREAQSVEPLALGNDLHHHILYETCRDMDVIIIDNVTFALEPVKPGEMFNPETWNRVQHFTRWAKTAGKTVIFVDHTNKSNQVAGSVNKQRSADWVMILEAVSAPGSIPLEFGLKFDKMRYKCSQELTRDSYVTYDGLRWGMAPAPTELELIQQMTAEGMKPKDIADELCIGVRSVQRKLRTGQRRRGSQL